MNFQQPHEAVTTPTPDALTRLRNRPRLQVSNGAKTTAAPATNGNSRRHLVSSLLPKRRPTHPGGDAKDSATTEGTVISPITCINNFDRHLMIF